MYVGVRTTGIFCRPGCPAKPKPENRVLYDDVKGSLQDGYRPCKRCRPLSHKEFTSPELMRIVDAIEDSPAKTWKSADFKNTGAGQEFAARFGLTLKDYARLRNIAAHQTLKRTRFKIPKTTKATSVTGTNNHDQPKASTA